MPILRADNVYLAHGAPGGHPRASKPMDRLTLQGRQRHPCVRFRCSTNTDASGYLSRKPWKSSENTTRQRLTPWAIQGGTHAPRHRPSKDLESPNSTAAAQPWAHSHGFWKTAGRTVGNRPTRGELTVFALLQEGPSFFTFPGNPSRARATHGYMRAGFALWWNGGGRIVASLESVDPQPVAEIFCQNYQSGVSPARPRLQVQQSSPSWLRTASASVWRQPPSRAILAPKAPSKTPRQKPLRRKSLRYRPLAA